MEKTNEEERGKEGDYKRMGDSSPQAASSHHWRTERLPAGKRLIDTFKNGLFQWRSMKKKSSGYGKIFAQWLPDSYDIGTGVGGRPAPPSGLKDNDQIRTKG